MRDRPCRMDGLCAEVVEPSHYWEEPAAAWAVAESPAVYRPRHPERSPRMKNASSPARDRCGRWSCARSRICSAVAARRAVSPGSGARSAGRSTCWPFPAAPGTSAPVARPNAPSSSPRSSSAGSSRPCRIVTGPFRSRGPCAAWSRVTASHPRSCTRRNL